jgi:hypothetical protein
MPTPKIYKKIAIRLKPRGVFLWILAFVGFALVAIPFALLALRKTEAFPSIPVAFGLALLVDSWGFICIKSWFSEKASGVLSKKLRSSFPRIYTSGKLLIEWYASIFLDLWFCAGAVIVVVLIIKL